jgi:hypothetical protein
MLKAKAISSTPAIPSSTQAMVTGPFVDAPAVAAGRVRFTDRAIN